MTGKPGPGAASGKRSRRGGAAALLAASWIVSPALAAPAGIPPPGALSCAGCHGPAGGGPVPGLAGRPAADIVADMQAFRTGARSATVMDRIARGFTDEETRAIAEWLSAPDGTTPPVRPLPAKP